ncbi:unnamed protein product [Adineta steineri]|uniref:Glucosylceramidase n=2 Tax=Adineta steineri TaxID=433720 RepID=A0A814CDN3_9BILA|nr:unnamed protein product [Adineta steineri]
MFISINYQLILIILGIYSITAQSPCDIVTFEYGNVCRCTEKYCDVIDPLGIIPNAQAAVYESTSEYAGTHRLTKLPNLQFQSQRNPNITDLYEIDYTTTYQSIIGFGGAFTDSSAVVTSQLSANLQKILLEQYFGKDGLNYNIGRIPMGAADFSLSLYTYASVPNDFDLNNFTISMDLPIKIPFIKSAMAMSNETIYFFGSPWYAPDWLKNASNPVGTLNGVPGDKYHKSWARYFSKFIEAYESQGIPIWGITSQNEYSQVKDFKGLFYTSQQLADWVRVDLGPELRTNHPSVKIMIYDDDMDLMFIRIADMINRNTSINKYVDGIAVHWYATVDMIFPDFYEMYITRLAFPQFFYFASEACEGYLHADEGPKMGMWRRGTNYALSIIGDLLVGATGWTDWNVVLDLHGGPNQFQYYVDSPIIANTTSANVFYKNPMYYAMGHFSKFLPRDSIRVEMKLVKEEKMRYVVPLKIVSFKTPINQMVIIALNQDTNHTQIVQVKDPNHGYLTLTLLPESIQTVVYNVATTD